MADVLITPGSGRILFTDAAGSPQGMSIVGYTQNQLQFFGDAAGSQDPPATALLTVQDDNGSNEILLPGADNYALGSSSLKWKLNATQGRFSPASGTANINMGSAGSVGSPSDGDFWYDGTNLYFRNASTTYNLTAITLGTAFVQGGNSFGATATLGTNDSNALAFETNNTERARFDTSGNLLIGHSGTASGTISLKGTASQSMITERAASGAGNSLTVQAGGAESGGSGLSGGTLLLSGGISTGLNGSEVHLLVGKGVSFGSSDNTPAVVARFTQTGISLGSSTQEFDLTLSPTTALIALPFTYTIAPINATSSGGNNLVLSAGNMTSGSDLVGGTLTLQSGASTGSAASQIDFKTATAGGSGGTVRTPSTKMSLSGLGKLSHTPSSGTASINLSSSNTVSSPSTGDLWWDSGASALNFRSASATFNLLACPTGSGASGRVAIWTGASTLGSDSTFTFSSGQLSLSTTGSSGGVVLGGDANLYRSSADVLKTDDSLVVGVNLTVSSITAGSVLFAGASGLVSQDNSNLYWDDSNNFLSVGAGTSPAARVHIAGAVSSSAWDGFGIALSVRSATFTDTSSSGTVASNFISAFRGGTLAASSSTTYTDVATLAVTAPPGAGSNVAITRSWSLFLSSGSSSFLGDSIVIGDVAGSQWAHLSLGGNLSVSAWGTLGPMFHTHPATFTDTSSSGTVASAVVSSHSVPTLAASSSTTFTDAANLYIAGPPTAGSNVVITNALALWVDSGTTRLDGALALPNATSGSTGIVFSSDTNLYRSAADTLKTDDSLVVGASLTVSSLTSTRVVFAGASGLLSDSSAFTYTTGTGQLALTATGSAAGLLIGGDTQLYRSAADVLRTPDSLTVDVNLTVGSLTSGRVPYLSTGGLFVDSTNFTYDGTALGVIVAGITTTTTAGLALSNTTTTSGVSTLQYSPAFDRVGHGWTGLADRTIRFREELRPTSAPTVISTLFWMSSVDTGTASWTDRMSISSLGQLTVPTTGSSAGILVGGDAQLYRSAADTWRTPDSLIIDANLTVASLTSTRVPFASTGGLLIDSSAFVFTTGTGELALSTSGSAAGILIGGDAKIYRRTTDIMALAAGDSLEITSTGFMSIGTTIDTTAKLRIDYTHSTVGSGFIFVANFTQNALQTGGGAAYIANITGTASRGYTGSSFFFTGLNTEMSIAGGSENHRWVVATSCRVRGASGQTGGTVQEAGGGNFNFWNDAAAATFTTAFGGKFDCLSTAAASAGAVTTGMAGYFRWGSTHASATATWGTCVGIYLEGYNGGGGAVTNWYGINAIDANAIGSANVTNAYWASFGNLMAFTANNQTRVGIKLEAIPDPTGGGYTGTTTIALWLSSDANPTTARDAIVWGSSKDTNLYRSAADTLKTDDTFVAGTGLTIASLSGILAASTGAVTTATIGAGLDVTGTTIRAKRAINMIIVAGFTPAGTGGDAAELVVPYKASDGTTSLTWNVRRINFRVSTAGGAPAVTVEKYTGTGAFSATTVGSVTLGSGASEGSQTSSFTTSTLSSGDKIRINPTALGTAAGWTVELMLEEA